MGLLEQESVAESTEVADGTWAEPDPEAPQNGNGFVLRWSRESEGRRQPLPAGGTTLSGPAAAGFHERQIYLQNVVR